MVKNGNFRSLLLKLIFADQLAHLPPSPVEASSGHKWKFKIAIFKANIGRSTGRSTPPLADISPSTGILWSRMVISHCYCGSSYWQMKWQIHPYPIKHRSLEYCYTEIGRSTPQSTIDPLSTTTPKWQIYPPSVQCIMGCILWDVFGSHSGLLKRKSEFAFISE